MLFISESPGSVSSNELGQIIALLKDLIGFKTKYTMTAEIDRCASFIEDFFKENKIDYKRYDHGGSPSLLVCAEEKEAPVLLMSHIDVVDAPDEMFVPRQLNGNLYGRGAIDDKYAVAVSLILLKQYLQRIRQNGGDQKDLPFGILITSDEETGGLNGADKILAKVKTRFCITMDGGSPERAIVKEKGVIMARLKAKGKSAHGARPWLGTNAIDILINDLIKIRALFNEKEDHHWHKTLNIGAILAGESTNKVPDSAEAALDIRYTEKENPEVLIRQIKEMIQSEFSIESAGEMFFGGESDYLDLFLSVAQDAKTDFEHGSSDARFLKKYGIPGIIWGANGNNQQHSANEHVEIASLEKIYSVLDQFMTKASQYHAKGFSHDI